MESLDRSVAQFNAHAQREGWVQFCDPSNSFVLRDCAELIALWNAARRDGGIPLRNDFTIRMLKPYLARLVMAERVQETPPRFRFRLVGTIITQTLSERTGQHFDDASATAEQQERWTQSAQLTLTAGQPLRFPTGTPRVVTGEMLTLPLADESGAPRFVLAYGRYEPTRDWTVRETGLLESA